MTVITALTLTFFALSFRRKGANGLAGVGLLHSLLGPTVVR